jgi:putative nucleotidyltransferase with HDIG domain
MQMPSSRDELSLRDVGLDRMSLSARRRAVGLADVVGSLEAMPQVVHRALDCLQNSRSSSTELASIISTDQAIAARVLGLANSVWGRGVRQFVSVQEAVVRLGYRSVQDILLTASISRLLEEPMALYDIGPGELWRHSMATATAARILATRKHLPQSPAAYVAGLLHDAGRAVLDRALNSSEKTAIRSIVAYERATFHKAEYQALGFSHAEVGAVLLSRWGLGEDVVRSIARHHRPMLEPDEPLSTVVHAADVLALLAIPIRQPGWLFPIEPAPAAFLGLSADDTAIPRVMAGIREGLQNATRLVGPSE